MTTETPNYGLKKYEPTEPPNLTAGYNASMDTLDAALKTQADAIEAVQPTPLPDGLPAFLSAIGITASNATTLGAKIKSLMDKPVTDNRTITVAELSTAQVTDDGYIIIKPSGQ